MFQSEKINENLIRVNLPGKVCCYLIIGKESALLVDTGFGIGDLKNYVESLTDLPYQVILTHGHLDHAGGASQFDKVYLNKKDFELGYAHTNKILRYDHVKEYMLDLFVDECNHFEELKDEQVFDLGDIHVISWEMGGHTHGSMAIYIEEYKICILSDGCNSFTFLQLDCSDPIWKYRETMIQFKEKHYDQIETCLYSHPHNYGGKEIILEAIECCDDILNGDIGIDTGNNVYEAKAVDKNLKRFDGKTFNCLYRIDN